MSGKSCQTVSFCLITRNNSNKGNGLITFHISAGSVCTQEADAIVVGTMTSPQGVYLPGDTASLVLTLSSTIDIVEITLLRVLVDPDNGILRQLTLG